MFFFSIKMWLSTFFTYLWDRCKFALQFVCTWGRGKVDICLQMHDDHKYHSSRDFLHSVIKNRDFHRLVKKKITISFDLSRKKSLFLENQSNITPRLLLTQSFSILNVTVNIYAKLILLNLKHKKKQNCTIFFRYVLFL